jgi:hypothetical protein
LNPSLFFENGVDSILVNKLVSEGFLSDLASLASKDNIELGCKLIKKAVIQRALTKVRQDQQIQQAIKIRQNYEEFKQSVNNDEALSF